MLPDIDGLEVLRRLRARGYALPVLFLTARDAAEDRVRGLTVGGDDYVTKPFSLEELVARLRALLRRTGVTVEQPRPRLLASATSPSTRTPRGVRAAASGSTSPRPSSSCCATSCATRARVLSQGADPRPRVELRLRRPGQHRRALHRVPAQEDRPRARADDPHGARRRLRDQISRSDNP